jgi:serine protease Do
MRSGNKQETEVTIGKLDEENIGLPSYSLPLTANGNRIGLKIVDLEDVDKRRLEVRKGVFVSQVYPGAALLAGIQRGDVLTDVDGETITSAEQLERLVVALPDGISVHVRIVRNKRPQYLVLKVPAV